jgi:hypothetical protein
MGVRLIIMRKVKWTLIEFADLHGERFEIWQHLGRKIPNSKISDPDLP